MFPQLDPTKDSLFLDIDGTIVDIAPTPTSVVVDANLIKNLSFLYEKLGSALAFISGRKIEDIDHLFSPLRLPAAGCHGAQWRFSPDSEIETLEQLAPSLRQNFKEAFKNYQGILVEDKEFSVAIHYRLAPNKKAFVHETVTSILEQESKNITIIDGTLTLEILSNHYDKGQILEKMMRTEPFKNRRPIFLGDDTTDLAAINMCSKLGGIGAWVGHDNTPCEYTFTSAKAVRSWLNDLVSGPRFTSQ